MEIENEKKAENEQLNLKMYHLNILMQKNM
jgi:hypothetical protein